MNPTPGPILRTVAAVELHIDTLVVDGIALRHAGQLGPALQRELESLLAAGGLGRLASSALSTGHLQIRELSTPSLRLPRQPHAADAGVRIARAVHGGLTA